MKGHIKRKRMRKIRRGALATFMDLQGANNHFHVGPNIAISDTAIIDRGRNVLCKDQGFYATFIILVIRA